MIFRISAFTALIILSNSASANWFDSFNNSVPFANSYNLTIDNKNTNTTTPSMEKNKENTNTKIGLGISMGSIGNTNLNTASKLATSTNSSTTDMFAPLDFNPSFAPSTPPTAEVQQDITPTQDYTKLKAMWEAQRKQAEDMLKRIEEAQKSVASHS